MSPPRSGSGPGATPRPATTETAATARKRETQGQDMPGPRRAAPRHVATGVWYPPAGRRRLGVVIVRRCPACLHLHLHRAMLVGTADGSTRIGGCGRAYVLRVLPAADRAGSRGSSA